MIQCSVMSPDMESQTGSLSVKVAFLTTTTPDISFDAAIRSSIDSVEIVVAHSGGTIQRKYAYDLKQATIPEIAAGSAMVTVNAYDLANTIIVTGTAANITIVAGQSNDANVVVGPEEPLKPYLLVPVKNGNQVTLTWVMFNAPTVSFKFFTIQRQSSGGIWQQMGTEPDPSTRSWTDNSPPAGNYLYQVSLVNQDNSLLTSNSQSVVVSGSAIDSLIPVLSTPVLSGSSVNLAWTFPIGAQGSITNFTIQRTTDAGTTWSTLGSVNSSLRAYTDNAPVAGTVNGYRISCNEGATTHISDRKDITVPGSSMDSLVPILNNPTLNGTSVSLTWAFPSNLESRITGFVIRRTTDNGASFQDIGNRAVSNRDFTDLTPINGVQNGYEVAAVDNATNRHYSVRKFIQVNGTIGTVKMYEGVLINVTNALTTSSGNVWIATDPNNLPGGHSEKINVSWAIDTILGGKNTVIFHNSIAPSKIYVFLGQPINAQNLLLYANQPVVNEFVAPTNGFIPYNGTLDGLKAALQTSAGQVFVNDSSGTGTGMQEWVDTLSIREISITRKSVNVNVIVVRDNFNFKGPPPREYIIFGQPQSPNQIVLVGNRPSAMSVLNFQNLP